MIVSAEQIVEKLQPLVKFFSGNTKATATKPCAQEAPIADGITYVSDKKTFLTLLQSPVNLIVADAKLLTDEKIAQAGNNSAKTILQSNNVYLAMALINQTFFPIPFVRKPFHKENIHPSAIIHPEAKLAANVVVGPGAVISAGVTIGARTYIGANTVIENNVSIGEECFIHALVAIGHTVRIGNRCEIKPHAVVGSDGYGYAHDEKGNHYRLPHYGELIIEDDVHIGANVNIDRGTYGPAIIRFGTKIDNHCHFGHNVDIGKNNLITAGFISAGSVKIGANAIFGGRTSVNNKVELCDNVTAGGMTVFSNDITKPGMYAGFPATDYKTALRAQASIASLPRLRRNLAKVMKHLGLKEDEN
jgi:UDP-3-O-[3-hydroxymyristoyl] glucosamine N-acyltransferase